MKKIINNKLYNTKTAKFLGSDSYSNERDFNYWHEKLYVKKTGEFFLWGEGGPKSKYAEQVEPHCYMGGCDITPLSLDEAREWAERHLSTDVYIELFGEPEE